MTAKLSLTRWNPGAGKTFANFSNRVAQTDALLSKIIGTGPPAEWVDVGGYYVSPNEEIGPDKSANLTNHTTFGCGTVSCGLSARLNGFSLTFDSGNGNPFNYTGVVSGAGSVIFDSAPTVTLRFGGTVSNNYSGATLVKFGLVTLEKPQGQNALFGAITVGGRSAGFLRWAAGDQIVGRGSASTDTRNAKAARCMSPWIPWASC